MGERDARTATALSLASDSVRRRLDWPAFDVLDTNKNERGLSISFGDWTRTTISVVGRLCSVHLRRCHHRNSLGGTMSLSRDNGKPQSPKAPARSVSDLGCGCSFPQQRTFSQRTTALAFGHISDLLVAVAFCFVAVDPSAAVRPEGITVVTSQLHSFTPLSIPLL
jgi:hypothetical protein